MTDQREALREALDNHEHTIGWDRMCTGADCGEAIARALWHEHQWSAPNDLATCVICDLPRRPTRRSTDLAALPSTPPTPEEEAIIRARIDGSYVPDALPSTPQPEGLDAILDDLEQDATTQERLAATPTDLWYYRGKGVAIRDVRTALLNARTEAPPPPEPTEVSADEH